MRTTVLLLAVVMSACVAEMDDPTQVKDLRVLGMRLEPPEILMAGCDVRALLAAVQSSSDGGTVMVPPQLQQLLATYASAPLKFTALVADPAGNGRQLKYRLRACSKRSDKQCDNDGEYVDLASGTMTGGEVTATIRPGIQFLDDGQPLLLDVISDDTFKGLGGVRVPIVLEVSAADTGEQIYANKLMVYTCQFFPEMTQNVTPILPGITWADAGVWAEDEVKEWSGRDEVKLLPIDFIPLEEAYVVPSLLLTPVNLVEAWKVTWMTTSGTMSSYNTGGTDFVGVEGLHNNAWKPSQTSNDPQDVTIYFVVRDGRGGNSWMTRHVRWTP